MAHYLPLFKALNDSGVQYIIVGGLATVLHGYARLTADIDLVINLSPIEAEKAIRTFTSLGLKPQLPIDPLQISDEAIRQSWAKNKNMIVLSFYQPDNPLIILDIFIKEPYPFKQMLKRAILIDIGGINVPVCAINDLIEMKQKSARTKDFEDIKFLQGLLSQDKSNET